LCIRNLEVEGFQKSSNEAVMKSVLFYCDSAQFGGHEAMTIKAIGHLCQQGGLTVTIAFYPGNVLFKAQLESIQRSTRNLSLVSLKSSSKSLQALRSLISWRKVRRIKLLMRRVSPDVVVVSQGRIEGSSMGLLAAKRAGYRTISYLPVAHPVAVSGKPFAVWIREVINGYFYRLPDKIVTISQSARRMLGERGATPNVVVVPNAVEARPIQESDRQDFRKTHSLTADQYVVATIGRIQFRDKGQDFALRAIARFRHELRDYQFIFVGQGPDENRLKAIILDYDLSDHVKLIPWTTNPAKVYAGIDMLLIPSRFEGVPLVMLEAMLYKLPIIASDRDGMAEFLPREWLFPYGDGAALVDTLRQVREKQHSDLLETHRLRVLREFSTEQFCANIRDAILDQGIGDVQHQSPTLASLSEKIEKAQG
jgi:glycosyltransferase involved in cell wall biosynthesis